LQHGRGVHDVLGGRPNARSGGFAERSESWRTRPTMDSDILGVSFNCALSSVIVGLFRDRLRRLARNDPVSPGTASATSACT